MEITYCSLISILNADLHNILTKLKLQSVHEYNINFRKMNMPGLSGCRDESSAYSRWIIRLGGSFIMYKYRTDYTVLVCVVVCAAFILDGLPGKSNEKVWTPGVSQVN